MSAEVRAYTIVTVSVALATGAIDLVQSELGETVAALVYMLVVVCAASWAGLGPAIWASTASFVCWNFFFVLPYGTLYVSELRALALLLLYLLVAGLTSHIASQARTRAQEAQARERETRTLYEMSLEITRSADLGYIMNTILERIQAVCPVTFCELWSWDEVSGWTLVVRRPDTPDAIPRPDDAVKDALAGGRIVAVSNGRWIPLQSLGVLHVEGDLLPPQERMLETMANHAAMALQRDRLTAAMAEARGRLEAERLKASLLQSVSHDLRTPLSSIKAAATAVASEDVPLDDASRTALLRTIISNSDRLNGVVRNLLDMSRLEAGAWQPTLEKVPFGEVVSTVLGQLDDAFASRIQYSPSEDEPMVPLDEVQMGQVLCNVLENALKYSDGPIEIVSKVDAGRLAVHVRDRGPGVPPGQEQQIFHKFYRAHQKAEGGAPGLGIGLAICKGIVEAHGGIITASNHPSGGAVFTIELPT